MLYEKILAESKRLDKQIKQIQKELKTLPEGKLICSRNGKYYKWYRSDGKKEHYIPKKQKKLAEQLAIKKYLSYRLEDLIHEKRAIDLYLNNHSQKPEKSTTLLNEKPEYQRLISPYFKPKSQELSEWMHAPYIKNKGYPDKLIHKTSAGFCVRSKSEAMIVEELLRNGIPFRYDCLLELSDTDVYPDFTIRHPVTGELYLWEHFGRIDERKYANRVCTKLMLYMIHGYFPTINLITTYETKEHPLGIDTIRETIQKYFL